MTGTRCGREQRHSNCLKARAGPAIGCQPRAPSRAAGSEARGECWLAPVRSLGSLWIAHGDALSLGPNGAIGHDIAMDLRRSDAAARHRIGSAADVAV